MDQQPELQTTCDVLTLVGTQTREQKADTIKAFILIESMKLNILCATSGVGNAGIESSEIWAVYRVDFPPSITYVSQERGRSGCRDDKTPNDYIYQVPKSSGNTVQRCESSRLSE